MNKEISFFGLEGFKDIAKGNLRSAVQKGGSFQPVAIMESGFVIALVWDSDAAKGRTFREVGYMAGDEGVHKVLIIADCLYRKVDPKDWNYTLDNLETERPSVYPKAMCKEALVLSVHDLESQDRLLITIPYTIKDSEVSFEEEQRAVSPGSVDKLLLEGYIRAKSLRK